MGEQGVFTARQRVAGLLSLGASIALTVFTLSLLRLGVGRRFTPPRQIDPEHLSFNPEPVENLQYLVGLILLPLLLLGCYAIFRRLAGRLQETAVATLERRGAQALTAGLLGLSVAGLVASRGFVWGADADPWKPLLSAAVSACLGAVACAGLLLPGRFPRLAAARERFAKAAVGFGYSLIGLAGLLGVLSLSNITTSSVFLISFSAVFQPMVQVFLGRELLVDLPSQYGLYPHFLAPLFRFVGLSVLRFTVLMALLNVAAFLLIFRALRGLVTDGLLAGLAMVAVLYSSYFFGRRGMGDLFYQYHPIRFFFPALFTWLTWRYFSRRERGVYFLAFGLGALAVLWNPDSGVVVLCAWLAVLAFDEAARRTFGNIPRHLALGVGVFVGVAGAFSLDLYLRHGRFPQYGELFHYQKVFYLQGFGMMPMPLFHPWNVVALLYAAGLLHSAICLVERAPGPRAASVFFLSVMGAGLFSYYQGRSADSNLMLCGFPAILLAAFFADRLVDRARREGLWRWAPLAASCAFALTFALVDMFRFMPEIARISAQRWMSTLKGDETPITNAARFIKERTHPGEEVMIVSSLLSIYHLESRTVMPPRMLWFGQDPVTSARRKAFLWSAAWRAKKVFVASEWDLMPEKEKMLQLLPVADATPDGYMHYLLPEP